MTPDNRKALVRFFVVVTFFAECWLLARNLNVIDQTATGQIQSELTDNAWFGAIINWGWLVIIWIING